MTAQELPQYINTGQASLVLILSFALIIWLIGATWAIFERAGEAGWKCLIPIYGEYILFKIAFGSGWVFLTLLIPFVNIIMTLVLYYKLGKRFKKGTGFCVGLMLFPAIFLPILAFCDKRGKARPIIAIFSIFLYLTIIGITGAIAASALEKQASSVEETSQQQDDVDEVIDNQNNTITEDTIQSESTDVTNDQDQAMGNAGIEEDDTNSEDNAMGQAGQDDTANNPDDQDQAMGNAGIE